MFVVVYFAADNYRQTVIPEPFGKAERVVLVFVAGVAVLNICEVRCRVTSSCGIVISEINSYLCFCNTYI